MLSFILLFSLFISSTVCVNTIPLFKMFSISGRESVAIVYLYIWLVGTLELLTKGANHYHNDVVQ